MKATLRSVSVAIVLALTATAFQVRAGEMPIGGYQCSDGSTTDDPTGQACPTLNTTQVSGPAPDSGGSSATLTDILMQVMQGLPKLL